MMNNMRLLSNVSKNNGSCLQRNFVGNQLKWNNNRSSFNSSVKINEFNSLFSGMKNCAPKRMMQTNAQEGTKVVATPFEHSSSDKLKQKDKENPLQANKASPCLKEITGAIKVEDILKSKGKNDIIYVDENDSTYNAVKLMSQKDMGAVVVTSNGKPKGIFTERDYMTKLILKGKSSKKTPIKEVTEYKLHTVSPNNTLRECADIMIKKVIRHLPIVGEDGKYLGMISVRDVAEHMVRAGHKASDVKLAQSPDTLEDVFNRLGRVSSEECFVDKNDSVLKALELMDKHRIGAVFVTDGQKLVGIFTERDYLHKVILQEKASKSTEVGDVMTSDVVVVSPTEQIGRCLTLMVKGKFRNLPVVPLVGDNELDSGEYKTVLGIITLVDVIRFLLNVGK